MGCEVVVIERIYYLRWCACVREMDLVDKRLDIYHYHQLICKSRRQIHSRDQA
jgi:hypothetical protein